MKLFKSLIREEKGQGLVEYALIIALVAVLLITALLNLKGGISGVFSKIQDELTKSR
jgi:pilus assembly protein Flp/PilA